MTALGKMNALRLGVPYRVDILTDLQQCSIQLPRVIVNSPPVDQGCYCNVLVYSDILLAVSNRGY